MGELMEQVAREQRNKRAWQHTLKHVVETGSQREIDRYVERYNARWNNDYRRDEGEIIQAGAEIEDEDLFDTLLELFREKENVTEW